MQAIILAGGFGTRLQGVVKDVPKPMAPIGDNKPFLLYLLRQLKKYNFTKVVMAVGYLHEVIEDFFGNEYDGIEIIYSLENEPLGTGGCIKKALEYIDDEYVYIINGDTYFDVDLNDMKTNKDAMIACKYLEDFSRYGKVAIEDGRIIRFEEKKEHQTGYINGGIYLFKKSIFDGYNMPTKFSLEKDFYEVYLDNIYIEAYLSNDYFMDIGIPSDYYQFIEDFKNE